MLENNVGRFKGTPRGARVCPLCDLGEEDESHFLWQCGAFDTERVTLWEVVTGYVGETILWDMPYEERTFMVLGAPNESLSNEEHMRMLCELAPVIGGMYQKRLTLYRQT